MAYLATRNAGLSGWGDSLKSLLSKTSGAVDAYGAMKTQEQVAEQYAPPSPLQAYRIPLLAGLGVTLVILARRMK